MDKLSFTPIALELYIKKHIECNPSENPKDLRKRLKEALQAHKQGIRCDCGNSI